MQADTDWNVAADVAVALRAKVERRARVLAVRMRERAEDDGQFGRLPRWLARGVCQHEELWRRTRVLCQRTVLMVQRCIR